MLGAWNVNVTVGAMPQKVATAFAGVSLMGAEYTPIAYLGSQVVNGINHAVLAQQLVLSGKDTANVVLMIFREKGMECDLVNIERVVESGGELGGIVVDVKTDIPEEAKKVWDNAFEGFVGSKVEPFALLGTQVVNGESLIFAAELTTVTEIPVKKVAVVTVNAKEKTAVFTDLLEGKHTVGYSYAWLNKPLGEWP